jgi:poly(A) polymerase/tRNA nucleotidyltransferase (CCA-adding enzyme)
MENITKKLKKYPLSWINDLIKRHPDAEVYLVGGSVRDLLLDRDIKDLDFVVRNLEAKKLEKFLEQNGKVNFVGKSFGVYKFWPTETCEFDIALPRTEHSFNTGKYRDVEVVSNHNLEIEQDLERRDFTINAIALKLIIKNKQFQAQIIDPYGGQKDLQSKIIRTVGDPESRFQEDATRMLRAIRFACQLNFPLSPEIIATIKKKRGLIKKVAVERIQEELNKIIMSPQAERGFRLMQKFGILKIIMPELVAGVGVAQSRSHVYTVFEHLVRSLGFAAKRNYSLEMRWAALLHDMGKTLTKTKQGGIYTFYNHEHVGAKLARKTLRRLRYPEKQVKKISHLVYHHMFYYNIGEHTDSAIRRFIRKAGLENIEDLINLRIVDRLGMGRPKGKPFKLIELERRIKEVSLDPLSVKMLKINGEDVMAELKIKPSPKIGMLLNALLGEVLDDPKKNSKEYLLNRLKELNKLSDKKLKELAPDLEQHEEKRREKLIGKPLVYKGKKLERKVRKIKKAIKCSSHIQTTKKSA